MKPYYSDDGIELWHGAPAAASSPVYWPNWSPKRLAESAPRAGCHERTRRQMSDPLNEYIDRLRVERDDARLLLANRTKERDAVREELNALRSELISDDLNLVCDTAFNWAHEYRFNDPPEAGRIVAAVERLRPHPTYEEWLNA